MKSMQTKAVQKYWENSSRAWYHLLLYFIILILCFACAAPTLLVGQWLWEFGLYPFAIPLILFAWFNIAIASVVPMASLLPIWHILRGYARVTIQRGDLWLYGEAEMFPHVVSIPISEITRVQAFSTPDRIEITHGAQNRVDAIEALRPADSVALLKQLNGPCAANPR